MEFIKWKYKIKGFSCISLCKPSWFDNSRYEEVRYTAGDNCCLIRVIERANVNMNFWKIEYQKVVHGVIR